MEAGREKLPQLARKNGLRKMIRAALYGNATGF
jgi:hypothetical protein